MRARKIKLTSKRIIIKGPFDKSNEDWVRCFIFFRDIIAEKLLFDTFCEQYTPNLIRVDVTFYYHILPNKKKENVGMNMALFYENPDDPNNPGRHKTYTARGVQGLYPKYQGKKLSRGMHDKYIRFFLQHPHSIVYIKALIISGMEYRQLARSVSRLYPFPGRSTPKQAMIELKKFIEAHGGSISPAQPFALSPDFPVSICSSLVDRMVEMKKKGDEYLDFYCKNACPPNIICNSKNCCERKTGLAIVIPLNMQNVSLSIFKLLIKILTKSLSSLTGK